MTPVQGNWLLVEGEQDRRVIPELVESAGITWGNTRKERLVEIRTFGGIDRLDRLLLATELKRSGLRNLGLVIDANSDPAARWRRVRELAGLHFTDFPESPSESGTLITSHARGVRFGVWMMPDNSARGMMETFLGRLVAEDDPVWNQAVNAATEAEGAGAPFRPAHRSKAELHTWLAWQDPPGEQIHIAAMRKFFDAEAPEARRFLAWFKKLYEFD